jgi:hypothetical protein
MLSVAAARADGSSSGSDALDRFVGQLFPI